MRIGLVPELTTTEKISLRRWLVHVLSQPNLSGASSNYSFPLASKIAIYIDGTAYSCQNGYWERTGTILGIGLGGGGGSIPVDMRIAILAAIISAAGLWDLVDDFNVAVSRALLESYNTMMGGLVQTQGTPTGLAFNASAGQVAARMGEEWHLPGGGGVVEIAEGDTNWVVVA